MLWCGCTRFLVYVEDVPEQRLQQLIKTLRGYCNRSSSAICYQYTKQVSSRRAYDTEASTCSQFGGCYCQGPHGFLHSCQDCIDPEKINTSSRCLARVPMLLIETP